MSTTKPKQDKPIITHTTQIGSVTGQVHTGSGNIIVGSFSSGSTVSTKDEFLSALRAFKAELETARQQGLPEETADDTIVEVEAAEREAEKNAPKADRIIKRLENAKAILIAGTGVATAVTAAAEAASKLIPLVETAIKTVSKIF
jgi:ABC-type uncharacterized transport system substrate-binding protein